MTSKKEYHTLKLTRTLKYAIDKTLKQRKSIWEAWTIEAIDVVNDKLVVKRYISEEKEADDGRRNKAEQVD